MQNRWRKKRTNTHTHRHMQKVYSWMEKKKITKTLHWWWSAKKVNGEVTMWSDPVARRKIENNKNTAATATTVTALFRAHRRVGDETPLRIWLISQSYSFSCEAQMLHLWITIKRAYWLRRHEPSKRDTRTERTANRQIMRNWSCVWNIIFTVIVTWMSVVLKQDKRGWRASRFSHFVPDKFSIISSRWSFQLQQNEVESTPASERTSRAGKREWIRIWFYYKINDDHKMSSKVRLIKEWNR